MELPESSENVFEKPEPWTSFLKNYVDDNKTRIHKIASENLKKKVKPTLSSEEQGLLAICGRSLLNHHEKIIKFLEESQNFNIITQLCRSVAMLVQMPQNEESQDILLSQEDLATLTKRVFEIAKNASKSENTELCALKCLNNIFFSHKNLQDDFIMAEDGALLFELFLLFEKIHEESLPVYYMICLVLIAKYKEVCDPLIALATGTILKVCKVTYDNVIPGQKVKSDKIKFGNNTHYLLENGLKLVYGLAATNEKIIKKLEESFDGELTEEEGLKAMSALDCMDEKIPILDRLGFVLIRILLSEAEEGDTEAERALVELRHQSFCVMMFATKLETKENFIEILMQKKVVRKVVNIMDYFYQKAPPSKPGVKSTTEQIRSRVKRNERLLPILVVLNNFCETHEGAKIEIESLLFPFQMGEEDYSGMTEDEAKIAKRNRHMQGSTPVDSIGGRVVQMMTEFDQNIKRLSAELVWSLCDGDQGKFVDRAGYGNGVHLLAIKGGMLGQMMSQGNNLNK